MFIVTHLPLSKDGTSTLSIKTETGETILVNIKFENGGLLVGTESKSEIVNKIRID